MTGPKLQRLEQRLFTKVRDQVAAQLEKVKAECASEAEAAPDLIDCLDARERAAWCQARIRKLATHLAWLNEVIATGLTPTCGTCELTIPWSRIEALYETQPVLKCVKCAKKIGEW